MRKIFYLILITFILIAPIIFWLDMKWAMKFSTLDIKKLRFAFTRDKFLMIATTFNFILYCYVVVKIFNMNLEQQSKNNQPVQNKNSNNVQEQNNITPSASTGGGMINPNDAKWQEMYNGNGQPSQQKMPENSVVAGGNNIQATNEVLQTPPVQTAQQMQPQPQPQQTAPQEVQHAPQSNNVKQENIINIPVSANDVYTTQVERILSDTGYDNMGGLNINGVHIDFISIADSDTLIIGKINARNGDIVANETANTPDGIPSWFNNDDKYTSPVWEIKNASDEIVKMINDVLPPDNGVTVRPMVVVPFSNVVNYDEISPKWKESGVDVVKIIGGSALPSITDVIPDKTGVEVLDSYKKFVETLIKYFSQKYKRKSIRKAG